MKKILKGFGRGSAIGILLLQAIFNFLSFGSNSVYATFSQDNGNTGTNVGTAQIDFSGNLAGWSGDLEIVDADMAGGKVCGGSSSSVITSSPVRPAEFQNWTDVTLSLEGSATAELKTCGGTSLQSLVDGSNDISSITNTEECLEVSITLPSGGDCVSDLALSRDPAPVFLFDIDGPTSLLAGECGVYDVQWSLSYNDDPDTVVYVELPESTDGTISNFTPTYTQFPTYRPTVGIIIDTSGHTVSGLECTTIGGCVVGGVTVPENSVYWNVGTAPLGASHNYQFSLCSSLLTETGVSLDFSGQVSGADAATVTDTHNTVITSAPAPHLNPDSPDTKYLGGGYQQSGTPTSYETNFVEAQAKVATYVYQFDNTVDALGIEEIFNPVIQIDLSDTFGESCFAGLSDPWDKVSYGGIGNLTAGGNYTLPNGAVIDIVGNTMTFSTTNWLSDSTGIKPAYVYQDQFSVDFDHCSAGTTEYDATITYNGDNISLLSYDYKVTIDPITHCGDGTVQNPNAIGKDGVTGIGDEACDDGNNIVGDGCSACTIDGSAAGGGGGPGWHIKCAITDFEAHPTQLDYEVCNDEEIPGVHSAGYFEDFWYKLGVENRNQGYPYSRNGILLLDEIPAGFTLVDDAAQVGKLTTPVSNITVSSRTDVDNIEGVQVLYSTLNTPNTTWFAGAIDGKTLIDQGSIHPDWTSTFTTNARHVAIHIPCLQSGDTPAGGSCADNDAPADFNYFMKVSWDRSTCGDTGFTEQNDSLVHQYYTNTVPGGDDSSIVDSVTAGLYTDHHIATDSVIVNVLSPTATVPLYSNIDLKTSASGIFAFNEVSENQYQLSMRQSVGYGVDNNSKILHPGELSFVMDLPTAGGVCVTPDYVSPAIHQNVHTFGLASDIYPAGEPTIDIAFETIYSLISGMFPIGSSNHYCTLYADSIPGSIVENVICTYEVGGVENSFDIADVGSFIGPVYDTIYTNTVLQNYNDRVFDNYGYYPGGAIPIYLGRLQFNFDATGLLSAGANQGTTQTSGTLIPFTYDASACTISWTDSDVKGLNLDLFEDDRHGYVNFDSNGTSNPDLSIFNVGFNVPSGAELDSYAYSVDVTVTPAEPYPFTCPGLPSAYTETFTDTPSFFALPPESNPPATAVSLETNKYVSQGVTDMLDTGYPTDDSIHYLFETTTYSEGGLPTDTIIIDRVPAGVNFTSAYTYIDWPIYPFPTSASNGITDYSCDACEVYFSNGSLTDYSDITNLPGENWASVSPNFTLGMNAGGEWTSPFGSSTTWVAYKINNIAYTPANLDTGFSQVYGMRVDVNGNSARPETIYNVPSTVTNETFPNVSNTVVTTVLPVLPFCGDSDVGTDTSNKYSDGIVEQCDPGLSCVTGTANAGTSCSEEADCFDNSGCTLPSEGEFACDGGANDGLTCTVDADCPCVANAKGQCSGPAGTCEASVAPGNPTPNGVCDAGDGETAANCSDCWTGGNACAVAATSTCTSDCQEIGTCEVNGFVYLDSNTNDLYDSGSDTAQGSIEVILNGVSTFTNTSGFYSFTSLACGFEYEVCYTPDASVGNADSAQFEGSTQVTGDVTCITIPVGTMSPGADDTSPNNNFGLGNEVCGNGTVEGVEECDDGNTSNTDGCLNTCESATCGDGFIESGVEVCDDGNGVNTDNCKNDCTLNVCGDSVVNTLTEACDDGNTSDTDACYSPGSTAGTPCSFTTCGDVLVQAPNGNGDIEICDDGSNGDNTDTCQDSCVLTTCGDGAVQNVNGAGVGGTTGIGDEECDAGAANSDTMADACRVNCVAASCGDGVVDTGEACDDGNSDNTDGCLNTCEVASCGDGYAQAGVEACDDGNGVNTDNCKNDCTLNVCGDSVVNTLTEMCDDGNLDDADACYSAGSTAGTPCSFTTCGDVVVQAPNGNGDVEMCDDGSNGNNTDTCQDTCMYSTCGDGNVQNVNGAGVGGTTGIGDEECDAGAANSDTMADACRADCVNPSCGDGVVDTGEACDDGNMDNTDGCLDTCEVASCGDGIVQAGVEQCDDGNMDNTDGCLNTCRTATCGDGYVQAGVEECDDGNPNNMDACLDTCVIATCGDGYTQTGVEVCDDGNTDNQDDCLNSCEAASCGDGVIHNAGSGTEVCDDGNSNNQDDCLNSCEAASCSDGYVWNQGSGVEECDDGNAVNEDSCLNSCVLNTCGDGFNGGPAEACDDGNLDDTDACYSAGSALGIECSFTSCGDSVVQAPNGYGDTEMCDPGMLCEDGTTDCTGDASLCAGIGGGVCAQLSTSVCLSSCMLSYCGDGTTQNPNGTGTLGLTGIGDEQCDNAGLNSDTVPDACRSACVNPTCGDGVVDTGEACDDGANGDDTDNCNDQCEFTMCGDGTIQNPNGLGVDGLIGIGDEQCDDGVGNSDTDPDACRSTCVTPICGDNVTDSNEQCDDGVNGDDTDLCTDICQLTFCGDSVVQVQNGQGTLGNTGTGDEACDDGANGDDTDGCTDSCTLTFCGDGVVQPLNGVMLNGTGGVGAEECDDGAGNSDTVPDACRSTCVQAYCGDGIIDDGEECDGDTGTYNCTPECEIQFDGGSSSVVTSSIIEEPEKTEIEEPEIPEVEVIPEEPRKIVTVCGNGIRELGEACDDGANGDNTDGCTDSCTILEIIEPEVTEVEPEVEVIPEEPIHEVADVPFELRLPKRFLDTGIYDVYDKLLSFAGFKTYVSSPQVVTNTPEWFVIMEGESPEMESIDFWKKNVPNTDRSKYYDSADAVVAIPSVGIIIPVNYPHDEGITNPDAEEEHLEYLDMGAVHRVGTALPGSKKGPSLIEGHSAALIETNKGPFGAAMKATVLANLGDKVYVFTKTDTGYDNHTFMITAKEQIAPKDLDIVRDAGDGSLVISACGTENLVGSLDGRNVLVAVPVALGEHGVSSLPDTVKDVLDAWIMKMKEQLTEDEIVLLHNKLLQSKMLFISSGIQYSEEIHKYLMVGIRKHM